MPMSPRLLRPRAAVSTAFDPRSITGLELWLDVADTQSLGNTHTGAGGASLNGPIRYIADKSGNGRHALRDAADSAVPTLISGPNSRNAISFDGGDMIGGSWITLNAQSTFVVLRNSGSGGRIFTQQINNVGPLDDASGAGHYVPVIIASATSISSYHAGSFQPAITVPQNQWAIYCATKAAANSVTNYLNNGSGVSFTTAGFGSLAFTRYSLGASSLPAAFWTSGAIAEVLSYSRSLADAERTAVFRYLGAKYNIAQA